MLPPPTIPPIPQFLPIIWDLNYLSGVIGTSGTSEQDGPVPPGTCPAGGKSHGQEGYIEVGGPAVPGGKEKPAGKPVRVGVFRSHTDLFSGPSKRFQGCRHFLLGEWDLGPLFNLSATEGHLCCFRFWNSSARFVMNIFAHTSVWK